MPFAIKIERGGAINIYPNANGFEKYELDILQPILNQAYNLSQYSGAAKIYKGNYSKRFTKETAAATISWPLFWFLNAVPSITIAPESFQDTDVYNYLGITLTHEFIHARQGPFKVFYQNFLWIMTCKKGCPQFEEEAYNSINLWHDNKHIF